MDLIDVIDFANKFLINIVNFLDQIFFTNLTIIISGTEYELAPIGLLIGGVGLLIGLIRRIL